MSTASLQMLSAFALVPTARCSLAQMVLTVAMVHKQQRQVLTLSWCDRTGEGKQMTLRMMIGCAVAIAGFCLYSHTRMAAKPAGLPNGDVEAAGQKVSQHHLRLTISGPEHSSICLC